MRERREVSIGEYESVQLDTDELTTRDVGRLGSLEERRVLTLSEMRTGWRLTAGATVGIVVLDRLRVIIRPKFVISGDQLIRWLSYAIGVPIPRRTTTRPWATARDGYADLVASALLAECQHLLHDGLRQDYVRNERTEMVLRGSLDTAAQATRRYGQLDRLHVRAFDRRTDIVDNRVLGTALRAARSLTTDPDLARELHRSGAAFPHAVTRAAAVQDLGRIKYTRLNARYRPAHTWARLVLRGGGVTDLFADTGESADGLLLGMPALWEAVVRRIACEAVGTRGGCPAHAAGVGVTVRGDLGRPGTYRPDLLLRLPFGDSFRTLPVDAKYKRYDLYSLSAGDVHQLLTYIAGHAPDSDPAAVIVHPRPSEHVERVVTIAAPHKKLGTIHVLGIATDATPTEAVAAMRSVLGTAAGFQ